MLVGARKQAASRFAAACLLPGSCRAELSSLGWDGLGAAHAETCRHMRFPLPRLQAAWSLELPPLLSAAVQLAGVVAVSFRNPSTCTATYMTQPLNTRLLGRLYRVLQPAVAPLEPLLAALGVDRANTAGRQCICGACGAGWLSGSLGSGVGLLGGCLGAAGLQARNWSAGAQPFWPASAHRPNPAILTSF